MLVFVDQMYERVPRKQSEVSGRRNDVSHNISSIKLTRTKLADLKEICSLHAAVEMLAGRVAR